MENYDDNIGNVLRDWEREAVKQAKKEHTAALEKITVETHKNHSIATYFSKLLKSKPELSELAGDRLDRQDFAEHLFLELGDSCGYIAMANAGELDLGSNNTANLQSLIKLGLMTEEYKPTKFGLEIANGYYKIKDGPNFKPLEKILD